MKTILWADVQWNHMGSHSGLIPLSQEVAACWGEGFCRVEIADQAPAVFIRAGQRLGNLFGLPVEKPGWPVIREKGSPFYNEKAWRLEKTISRQVRKSAPDQVVLECIEDQLFLLAKERTSWPRTRLVGITHQPPAWWRFQHGRPDIVSSLDLLVTVASGVKSFWSQFIDPDKIIFLPHGVDAEFFRPLERGVRRPAHNEALRVVFSGHWLRDFKTLAAVINLADQQALNVAFDLVVPRQARQLDACYQMAMSPRVRWYAQLTDEELRTVYQQADVLLLTLTDSTANNGLLEGMACGLPAMVTDVGGVRDYADDQCADFVRPGDPVEIIQLLKRHLEDRGQLEVRGLAARARVERNFTWKQVAGKFAQMLAEIGPGDQLKPGAAT